MPGCTGCKHVKQAGDTPYCAVPIDEPCIRGYFPAQKPIMKEDDLISKLHFHVLLKADSEMDGQLANAKNKQGICNKFKSLIPPKVWRKNDVFAENGNGWDFGAYAVAISMRDRILCFAKQHQITI